MSDYILVYCRSDFTYLAVGEGEWTQDVEKARRFANHDDASNAIAECDPEKILSLQAVVLEDSQGTQDPQPKPTGGPKGRPMEEAPSKERIMVWTGGEWAIAAYSPQRGWLGLDGYRYEGGEPKCWAPISEALACVPPPVLP